MTKPSVGLAGIVWNNLEPPDRRVLLERVWGVSKIPDYEAGLDWQSLLPSTQDALQNQDWNALLGRDVTP